MYNSVEFDGIAFSRTFSETVRAEDYFSHHHTAYELLYIINGDGIFLIEDNSYEFSSNSLIIIPPGYYHHVKKLPKRDYERCVLSFSPDLIPSIIEMPGSIFIPKLKDELKIIIEKFDRYADEYHDEALHILYNSLLNEFLINLAFEKPKTIQPQQYHVPHLIVKAIKYIDEKISEQISIETMSEKLFCSASYLRHLFTRTMDIGIKQYIIIKKMYRARELLQNGISAQNVAESLGYTEYSTFYRNYISVFNDAPLVRRN